MTNVRVTHDTSASPEACWAHIGDFGNIHRFNPYLSHSAVLTDAARTAVGTERQCDLKGGKGYLRERVIDWQDGRQYTVDIYDSQLPMNEPKTTLGLLPLERGTRLFMETQYRPRYGMVGALLDALVLRRVVAARFRRILMNLAAQAEGGEEPDRRIVS